jgi:PEP-CTERM motif
MKRFGKVILRAGLAATALTMAGSAQAALVVYSGYDAGSTAPGASAIAASNAFNAAVPGAQVENFESFANGATTNGVSRPEFTISSFGYTTSSLLIGPACGGPVSFSLRLCGGSTTPGGTRYATNNTAGSLLTFNFSTPINAFGAFFGGLQFGPQSTLRFSNGSAQSIPISALGDGGFSFLGFQDSTASITSITVATTNDVISVDDVRFAFVGGPAVPEPASWAMMIAGFGLVGGVMRRRANGAVAIS